MFALHAISMTDFCLRSLLSVGCIEAPVLKGPHMLSKTDRSTVRGGAKVQLRIHMTCWQNPASLWQGCGYAGGCISILRSRQAP